MRLVLVRHGRPAASSAEHRDPPLAPEGHVEARAMAEALEADGGRRPVVSSPMLRTRETAAAVEARWRTTATIDPLVGEIALPDELAARPDRLRLLTVASWNDVDHLVRDWRDALVERLLACDVDTVVVTHYFAINAAVSSATGDSRVVSFTPAHCSRTVLESRAGVLHLVHAGSSDGDGGGVQPLS